MSEQDAPDAEGSAEGSTESGGSADDDAPDDDPSADIDATDATVDIDDGFDEEALVERVEESDPESVAHDLAALRTRVEALEDQLEAREKELDDVTSKLKRKQADFQNYKKRMEKRREQEKQRAAEDVVERLLDVRDNLVRALDQDDPDVEDIRGGVESTLRGFDQVLEEENVTVVDPAPGDAVDPQRHEVLMRVDSDQPPDAIAGVHRPGYVMAEKVLRPAQVTVSEGSPGDADGDGDERADADDGQ